MMNAYKLTRTVAAFEHIMPVARNGMHIVKAGHAKGQPNKGVTLAPEIIVERHKLPDHIYKTGTFDDIVVSDCHDDCGSYSKVTIGGDHMVAYDSIAYQLTKVHNKRFGLVWVDAHADINTAKTSVTGNKHGMVISNLMGLCNSIKGLYDISNNYLLPENIVYIGLRSVDPPEKDIIRENDIVNFSSDMVRLCGGAHHINYALQWVLKDCDHIHVSFDVDVIDPKQFPATGTPVKNGISYRQVTELTKRLYYDYRVKSMDLVEYDPEKDDKDFSCGMLATDIITSTFTNGYAF